MPRCMSTFPGLDRDDTFCSKGAQLPPIFIYAQGQSLHLRDQAAPPQRPGRRCWTSARLCDAEYEREGLAVYTIGKVPQ